MDTERVLKLLFDSRGTVPPNVAFGFMQSICYGWNTDKRYRNYPVRPCVFGCGLAAGTDDFYHYYSCPIVQEACRKLGLDFVPPSESLLRHLLILDGTTQCQLRMTFLHACMTSVHQLRNHHSHVQHENKDRYIRGIFRDTVSRNAKLKVSFNLMWQERGFPNAL